MANPARLLSMGLLLLGLWLGVQGAWIYVKARLAQYLLQHAWSRTIHGEVHVTPWPWADTWPVARMSVPTYGVNLIILAGASGRTLAFGPGLVPTSAPPGQMGATILSAHRDTHFRFLEQLKLGDEILVEVLAQAPRTRFYRYRVTGIDVVDARMTRILAGPGHPSLLLVTCYPFDAIVPGGPLRYVVTAEGMAGWERGERDRMLRGRTGKAKPSAAVDLDDPIALRPSGFSPFSDQQVARWSLISLEEDLAV